MNTLSSKKWSGLVLSALLCFVFAAAFVFVGCGGGKPPQTPTSGYITVKGSDETLPLMMDEAYDFMDLYTKAKILVLGGGSDLGLAALFIDSAQIAMTTRPMSDEERRRAAEAGFSINEFKIGKDGIAIIVNPKNPVKKLTVDQVINIFTGKAKNWRDFGGLNQPIQVCIWDENSGTFAYFRDSILKGEKYSDKAIRFAYSESLIKNIGQEKGAIGMISMARLYRSWNPLAEDTRIKALPIGLDRKGEVVYPDESTVHAGTYPFIRYIYLYTPNEPKGLDAGFITFVTSSAGQKLLAGNGFVPITIPVKYSKED
jgi:phosphate transport system substrate-binding protein